ncbi:MAG: hypothetical protein ACE5OS_13385 [Anaerolineae bacterium]
MRIIVRLAVIAFASVLAVTASNYVSREAQVVLAGVLCGLGVMITIGMLIILVRQYDRED